MQIKQNMELAVETHYRVNNICQQKLSVIISLIFRQPFFLSLHVSEMYECIPITLRKATNFFYSLDLLKAI